MFWALLCPIQVSFQVQLGPKMGDLWLKYMRPQKCTIFMAKIAPNGGLVPGQRNPPGNWLLNGPYGKNSPWVHVKKMGLSNTRYSKYPMNLVRIGYWKLFLATWYLHWLTKYLSGANRKMKEIYYFFFYNQVKRIYGIDISHTLFDQCF